MKVVRAKRGMCAVVGMLGITLFAGGLAAQSFELYGSHTSGSVFGWGLVRFDTNPVTGMSRRVGAGGLMFDFDFDARGTLYSPRGDDLWTVDTSSGVQTFVGSFGITPIITSIAFAPGGRLFGTDNEGTNTSLYTIDVGTGRASRIGPVGDFVFGLDFAPNGTLYAASGEVFTINTATGRKKNVVIPFGGPFITALDYGADGVFRGVETDFFSNDRLWQIDVNRRIVTPIGRMSEESINGLASIPTPATLATLLMAGCLAPVRRRRSPTR